MGDGHNGLLFTTGSPLFEGISTRVERIERGETVKGGLGKPLTRKEAETIMMQAGMTRADIRRSVRMAQLPKELHETILAEVMRRKRLAENVAINAVWRAFQRLGG